MTSRWTGSPSAALASARQLRPQHLGVVQQRPQAPHAQRRVGLVGRGEEVQRLVRARVQHPHHDPALGEGLQHLPVGLDLLLLGRRLRAVVEEEELGAEQPDALGPGLDRRRHVRRTADVGQQRHLVPVGGGTRTGRGGQRGLALAPRPAPARPASPRSGRHEDLAGAAVDRDHRALGQLTGTGQRHHGRHTRAPAPGSRCGWSARPPR